MKLLVDNQLPLALAVHLRGWGLDCVHVLEVGLSAASDLDIWDRAVSDDRIVVSKDEDFLLLASRPRDGGRMIWSAWGIAAIPPSSPRSTARATPFCRRSRPDNGSSNFADPASTHPCAAQKPGR